MIARTIVVLCLFLAFGGTVAFANAAPPSNQPTIETECTISVASVKIDQYDGLKLTFSPAAKRLVVRDAEGGG